MDRLIERSHLSSPGRKGISALRTLHERINPRPSTGYQARGAGKLSSRSGLLGSLLPLWLREVPTGYVEFPKEILRPPRFLAERAYNIQRWEVKQRGGHFAAMEQPKVLAEEFRAFFRQIR